MNVSTQERATRAPAASTDLKEIAADVVRRAMQGGATAAEAVAMDGSEFSTVVRLGEVETLKESGSKAIGVRVFFGQRAASTYSSDLTPEGVKQLVDSALALAKVTSEDPVRRNSRAGATGQAGRRPRPVLRRRVLALDGRSHRLRAARRESGDRRRPAHRQLRGRHLRRGHRLQGAGQLARIRRRLRGAPTARFRRCRSRRSKARPCSATTGTRSR